MCLPCGPFLQANQRAHRILGPPVRHTDRKQFRTAGYKYKTTVLSLHEIKVDAFYFLASYCAQFIIVCYDKIYCRKIHLCH